MSPTPKNRDDYAERIAQELIRHLEAGTAPFQKPWQPAMGDDSPYNHTTGSPYRGSNALVLMMQPYDDPRWMTYKQARDVDAQVRKGEKGTSLLKLITHSERIKRDEQGKPILDQDGQPQKAPVKLEQPFVKPFVVFNAQQIDGLPAWEPKVRPIGWDDHQRAEHILAASGAEIHHKAADNAYYHLGGDYIVLPQKHQFAGQGAYYAVALHELGHWSGHPERLNRDTLGHRFGTADYAREELRAEIASMMLSRELGLPHEPERHAAYVQNWVQLLKDEPKEILYAARDAQKIKEFVTAFEQRPAPDPAHTAQAPVDTTTAQSATVAAETAKAAEASPAAAPNDRSTDEPQRSARERYLMQNVMLDPQSLQQRLVAEMMMERLIATVPPEVQETARNRFYEEQIHTQAHAPHRSGHEAQGPDLER